VRQESFEKKVQTGNSLRNSQSLLRPALKVLVENGDLWLAAKISGLPVDEFDEIRIKAKIPVVV
jgi:16S rRNA G1207 methylase RsmC